MESLHVPTVKTVVTVDMNGYDGFAALACVEDGTFAGVHCDYDV